MPIDQLYTPEMPGHNIYDMAHFRKIIVRNGANRKPAKKSALRKAVIISLKQAW